MDRGSGAGAARRHYILFVLVLVGTMNFVDRNIMSVLIEPIRHELQLSDTQMGFLTGIAFALTYVTLAIPAGALADRWSRRNVIALAVLTWSVMTILCGLARNAFQIFLARFGVGFGEAGGSPPSHALISDLFPREKRATAMAIFALSSPLGVAVGLIFGGWSLEEFGWRNTFILAGLPGLLLAPLVVLTVRDVPKGMADGVTEAPPTMPFLQAVRALWAIRTIRYLMFVSMLQTILTHGLTTWVPAFLMRSHGMQPAELGANLGVALGVGLAAGTLISGPLADRLGRRDVRLPFVVGIVGSLLSGSLSAAAFLAPRDYVIPLLGLQSMCGALFSGPLFAIIMTLSPVAARATAAACVLVVINAMVVGVAPQVVGILSDLLRPGLGEESLRVALLSATTIAVPTALLFFLARRAYPAELDAAMPRNEAPATA